MRRIKRLLICFFAVVQLGLQAEAQHYIRFQNLRVNDGLSMGTITGVQKDSQGYVWIATAEGLHRYDGTQFSILKHEDGIETSLSDSYIRCILLQGDHIYIGTNAGTLDILDTRDLQISHVSFKAQDPAFDFPVSCMAMQEGRLLIGTEGGGMWFMDTASGTLQKESLLKMEVVHAIQVDGAHAMVGGEDGIYSSMDGYKYLRFYEAVLSIAKHRGHWYAGTPKGLWKQVGTGWMELELPPRKRLVHYVASLLSDGDLLWVGTHGGLLRISESGQELYRHNPVRPFSLASDKVSALFDDGDGVLWVGTLSGLSRYARELQKFGLLEHFDLEGETYNNNVYCVYPAPEGGVWLGTLTGGMVRFVPGKGIMEVHPVIRDGSHESRAVRSMYLDRKGRFWVGTRDEGLFHYRGNGQFRWVGGQGEMALGGQVIRSIMEDDSGRLWVGHEFGLAMWDEQRNGFMNYAAEPGSRTNNATYQVIQDRNRDRLILGSFRGGIQFFDLQKKSFRSLKYRAGDSTSLSNNNVMCLEWLGPDRLAIGTYGGGLNILDLNKEEFTHLTEMDGLANNAVYGILRDGDRALWLSTNNGLSRLDLVEGGFTNFRPIHYLQSTEFNEGAFARDAAGRFYFGGVSGLNYFMPGQIPYRTHPPQLAVTGIRGAYERFGDLLELPHGNSRLELDFTALYYADPQGVRYRYRMKGYDQQWVEAGTVHTAYYPRLQPGNYTFELEAQDEFGQWMAFNTSMRIHIRAPFWQTWWFILGMVALVALIVWLVFRFRTRAIKRSYQLQLVDSELSALRSQMNPHFIFNSLNSIQYYILKKQPQEAYNYLSKFASLMRKILQNSRYRYISVADEIEWLELYLEMERLRLDGELETRIECIGMAFPDKTFIPTMLVQPYVENSIIHGLLPKENDRKLWIRFIQEQDSVRCEIQDNGIGRQASEALNAKRTNKHRSAGMHLTRSRLRILSEGKGHFDVQITDLEKDGLAEGTMVTVIFPIITDTDA